MPRCARAVSLTGYYHVFDRGNSKQIIFEDDSDRYRFLSDISDRFARHKVAVLAWCLMDTSCATARASSSGIRRRGRTPTDQMRPATSLRCSQ